MLERSDAVINLTGFVLVIDKLSFLVAVDRQRIYIMRSAFSSDNNRCKSNQGFIPVRISDLFIYLFIFTGNGMIITPTTSTTGSLRKSGVECYS